MAITYGSLRNRALNAADMVGSDFPDTSTTGNPLKMAINSSIAALYDLLLSLGHTSTHAKDATITHTTATDKFVVATDCYKIMKLVFEDTDGTHTDLVEMGMDELTDMHVGGFSIGTNDQLKWCPWDYWNTGTTKFDKYIKFSCNPASASGAMRYYYSPELPDIGTSDADVLPINIPRSWEDWLVYDIAARLHDQEETDASKCEMRREKAEQAITRACRASTKGRVHQMKDTSRRWG